MSADTIHATCVAIRGVAVLIAGPSGAGKSDLALRLIDRGWSLVSDDRTALTRVGDRLFARPPDRIAGLMEVRGVGIVTMPFVQDVAVALLVEADDTPPRLPDPETTQLFDISIPRVRLALREASCPCKIDLLLEKAMP